MNSQAFLVVMTFLAAASLALGAAIPNATPNSSPTVDKNSALPSNPNVQVSPPAPPVKEGGAPDDLTADATIGFFGLGGYYGPYYGGWYGRGWGSPYWGGYYGGYGRPYYGGYHGGYWY